MIRINKRPLPDGVTITREEDYRGGVVLQMLIEDCRNKCYICEDSVHTAPNVEHRIPHRGEAALKYDWGNLLLACSHCNNIKSDKYGGLIDPTKVNPEEFIKLSLDLDDDLREMVIVQKIAGHGNVGTTVDLLNAVYNGGKTDMKGYACRQLKNKISHELVWFRGKIETYKANPNDSNRKALEQSLSDSSVFAAFKREIFRSDPELPAALNLPE